MTVITGDSGRMRPGPEGAQLVIGFVLTPFERGSGFHQWNRYAAVNDEFQDIHMDDDVGRAAGFDSAIGMGNLQFAYIHNLLREFGGEECRVIRLSCQFRKPSVKGDTVSAHGVITAIVPGPEVLIDLDVWTENRSAEPLARGTATIAIRSA